MVGGRRTVLIATGPIVTVLTVTVTVVTGPIFTGLAVTGLTAGPAYQRGG